MRLRWTKPILGILACLFVSSVLTAADVPLVDWEVQYQGKVIHSPGGIGKAGLDISLGIGYVATEPCRIVDTRPSQGFPPAWGAPILTNGVPRNFDLNSAPHCAGIPAGVEAYSVNFTIAEPVGPGDLRAYPQGSPPAVPTSVMNWSGSGPAFAIANAGIIPAGTSGGITVQTAGSNAHVIIDINGYFTDEYNTDNYFSIEGVYNFGGGLLFVNNNTTTVGWAINAITDGTTNGVRGVSGHANGATGITYGVYGTTDSNTADAAGVRGTVSTVNAFGVFGSNSSANGVGVRGDAGFRGVEGNATGDGSCGVCGTGFPGGTGSSGVSGFPSSGGSPFAALYSTGNLLVLGSKSFLEPHAGDASKQINYIAIEGPEPRTFFTGRGRFERGTATIRVPDHFRLITDEEGLTVQITPIGAMASVAVMRADLNEIVVQSSRSVEFFYTVSGIRAAFRHHQPVEPNLVFRPDSPGGRDIRPDISEAARQAMIKNGTLNSDGSWNAEKAREMGWKIPKD